MQNVQAKRQGWPEVLVMYKWGTPTFYSKEFFIFGNLGGQPYFSALTALEAVIYAAYAIDYPV